MLDLVQHALLLMSDILMLLASIRKAAAGQQQQQIVHQQRGLVQARMLGLEQVTRELTQALMPAAPSALVLQAFWVESRGLQMWSGERYAGICMPYLPPAHHWYDLLAVLQKT